MNVYDFLVSKASLFYAQAVYKFGSSLLTKRVSLANFSTDMDKRHYLVARGYRVTLDGKTYLKFSDYVRNQVSKARELGIIPEFHISHAWFLGGEVFLYDLVLDIEKRPLRENVSVLDKTVKYLRTYGLEPAVKISSAIERNGEIHAGFHVYVNLAAIEKYISDIGGLGILREKWSAFYNALIDRLELITGTSGVFDRAFGSEEHMIRAFLSPKADKENPSELLGFSVPVNLNVLKDIVAKGRDRRVLEYFSNINSALNYRSVPRSKIMNPKLFIALFRGLTESGNKLNTILKFTTPKIKIETLSSNPLRTRYGRKRKSNYNYVDEILRRGLEDGRKRFILYCASRYLVNVLNMNVDEALNKLMEFAEKSEKLPGFTGDGRIYRSWVRSVLRGVKKEKLLPYSLNKLKEKDGELYSLVVNALQKKQK